MKYSRAYRERVTLADGTPIEIGAVLPSDKDTLAAGFARLSPESRRRRFFTTKTGLTEEELRYLTEFDGVNHYALGALSVPDDGAGAEGIGVARLVRSETEPETAELSIVVVDDWQCRGVGSLLLQHIVAAAAERDIKCIRATALTDNPQIRELLERFTDEIQAKFLEPGVVEFRFPVAAPVRPDVLSALRATLRLVAIGALIMPLWFGRETVRRLLAAARGAPPETDDRA